MGRSSPDGWRGGGKTNAGAGATVAGAVEPARSSGHGPARASDGEAQGSCLSSVIGASVFGAG
jgi:hypothetical protein